jgi:hypothetical protein
MISSIFCIRMIKLDYNKMLIVIKWDFECIKTLLKVVLRITTQQIIKIKKNLFFIIHFIKIRETKL